MPPRPADTARPSPPTWWLIVTLIAGTFLIFSRSLGYDFINYDDPIFVTKNANVQAGFTWPSLVWAFTGRTDYWQPLTWLTHMLDWRLFGADATGHRAVNLAWHAANACLVFLLVRRITGAPAFAFFAAALFAWHPLRVESVVWITERKDVLSGFFFFATLLAYLRYGERLKARQPAGRAYALTLALFLGGLMSKPSIVTLPVVLLALDLWPLGRLSLKPASGWWTTHRCVVMEKLPFFLLSAVIAVVTVKMQVAALAFSLSVPLAGRLGNAVVSIARYLGNVVWPLDLAFFYEHPGAWPPLTIAAALALVLALTVFAWATRVRAPWRLAGWIWFLAMLLPALGILQVGRQAMADRYTYLPILGLQLAALTGLAALPRAARLKTTVAALALAACAGLTWWQQSFWRDSETLYRRAIAMDPNSSNAEAYLALTLHEANNLPEAGQHARRSLELDPSNHWGRLALAHVLAQTGRLAEAADNYGMLTDADPTYARAFYLRALLLQELGRLDEAEAGLRRATDLLPHSAQTRLALAELLARQRKFDEAAAAYEAVIARRPESAEAHAGLGYMRALTGRRDDAVKHWEEALRLRPDFPGLRERVQQFRSSKP